MANLNENYLLVFMTYLFLKYQIVSVLTCFIEYNDASIFFLCYVLTIFNYIIDVENLPIDEKYITFKDLVKNTYKSKLFYFQIQFQK